MATVPPPPEPTSGATGHADDAGHLAALSGLVVIGAGVVYMLVAKPYDRGSAAAGDAVPQERTQGRRHQVG